MLCHAQGKMLRLARGDSQAFPGGAQRVQQRKNAGIERVFKNALHGIIFPIEPHAFVRGDLVKAVKTAEGVIKRRTDKAAQLVLAAVVDAEPFQRIARGVHNAGAGIGQRSVQIKKEFRISRWEHEL